MAQVKKTKRLGAWLVHAMQQAIDYAEGKDVPRIRVHIPPTHDVASIRRRMKLSQKQFAQRF